MTGELKYSFSGFFSHFRPEPAPSEPLTVKLSALLTYGRVIREDPHQTSSKSSRLELPPLLCRETCTRMVLLADLSFYFRWFCKIPCSRKSGVESWKRAERLIKSEPAIGGGPSQAEGKSQMDVIQIRVWTCWRADSCLASPSNEHLQPGADRIDWHESSPHTSDFSPDQSVQTNNL